MDGREGDFMTPRIGGPYQIHYDTLRQIWITIDKCPYCGDYYEVSHSCNCIIKSSIERR